MAGRPSVGVDIGGTKILAVVYSESDGIISSARIPTNRYATPDVLLPEVVDLIRHVLAEAGLTDDQVDGVGVGVPGLVSPDGIFIDSIILPRWISVDVGAWLGTDIKGPIIVDNDATMTAIGQWSAHHLRRGQTLLCLTLGTGVGAAIIVDGEPARGPDGTAGQLGHMTVDLFGRACSCGSAGCLNAYVSGSAIAERYLEHADPAGGPDLPADGSVTGEWVAAAAQSGDRLACEVIADASLYLGAGLAGLTNIFNPDIITIAGGVSALGDTLLDPARKALTSRAFRDAARRVRVEPGSFGTASGAVGAAISVWRHA